MEAKLAPTLSVVMPTYNAARHVREAIGSVLAQDFADFELLLVDDGSTDDTAIVLQEFATDPRVRVLRNERNLGLITTLHRAYGECRASLIARMDADDICEPSRFRKQVEFLRANAGIDIVGGAIRFFGNIPEPKVFQFPTKHDDIRPAMLFFCPLAHPALMFRRRLIDEGQMRYDEAFKHAEDYHLWSQLLERVPSANLPDVVLSYRLHPQQVSSDSSSKQHEASLRVRRRMLQAAAVDFSEDDFVLHESVLLERPLPMANYLALLAGWFERLETANARSGYWDTSALHAVLRSKFQETARRVDADLRYLARDPETGRYISASDAGRSVPIYAAILSTMRRAKARLWPSPSQG